MKDELNISDTNFNFSLRDSNDKMLEIMNEFLASTPIADVFDLTDTLIMILNENRQIVYANKSLLAKFGYESIYDVCGMRPGEIVRCKFAEKAQNGCGSAEECADCSALNTVLKSIRLGIDSDSEASIVTNSDGADTPINMHMHVIPYSFNSSTYYVVSIQDISDTMRRRELERIFFHDILNSAGALREYVKLISSGAPPEIKGDMNFIEKSFSAMVDDIIFQKQLISAEDDMLLVHPILLQSDDVLESIVRVFEHHDFAGSRIIAISNESRNIQFRSDYALLKRVIENMVKNALEASSRGDTVTIGCLNHEDAVRFWVHSDTLIPKNHQGKIFSRSFTTKGLGRGIGTYSMKLIGEKYLGGKVGFTSSTESGTTFHIDIPL